MIKRLDKSDGEDGHMNALALDCVDNTGRWRWCGRNLCRWLLSCEQSNRIKLFSIRRWGKGGAWLWLLSLLWWWWLIKLQTEKNIFLVLETHPQVREERSLQEAGRQLQEACDSLLQECKQEQQQPTRWPWLMIDWWLIDWWSLLQECKQEQQQPTRWRWIMMWKYDTSMSYKEMKVKV